MRAVRPARSRPLAANAEGTIVVEPTAIVCSAAADGVSSGRPIARRMSSVCVQISNALTRTASSVRVRDVNHCRVGVRGDEALDGIRLVDIARVEREGGDDLVELLAVVQIHWSTPFPSRAAAIRASPRRRRDLAVPSGIPSSIATCPYVVPPKDASLIASACSGR